MKERLLSSSDISANAVAGLPEVFASSKAGHERPGSLEYYTDQNIGVHIAQPETQEVKAGEYIIVPRSYEAAYGTEGGADLEAARDQVIANMTGKTVIGVDTPGFGMNKTAKRSFRQIVAGAFRGSMKRHAKKQIEAVKLALEAHGLQPDDEGVRLSLLGYSMGNIAVVDALGEIDRQLPRATIESIDMVESVSDQRFALLGKAGLLSAIGRETNSENVERYLDENARAGLKVSYDRRADNPSEFHAERKAEQDKAKQRGMLANLALGLGMRRGYRDRLTRELSADKYGTTKVRLFRANASEVAREEANTATYEALAAVHPDVSMLTIDNPEDEAAHHHPVWQSLPAVATIMHTINTMETGYVGRHRSGKVAMGPTDYVGRHRAP